MKKIFLAGLLAVCALAVSQQQASAWINSKFSIGMNWSGQSGGNTFGWGLWRNGQPPGPEAFGGGQFHGPMMHPGGPQGYAPMMQPSIPMPQAAYYYVPAQQAYPTYGSPYQFANYPRPAYYYPAPSYYYFGQ